MCLSNIEFWQLKDLVFADPPPPTNPTRVVILVDSVVSSYSSKYHREGYSSNRADTKSNSNTNRGDTSKSKKARVVIELLSYDHQVIQ